MKIVVLHTDLRIYWPARLKHLSKKLQDRGDELFVVEISGKGSPYAFASATETDNIPWICLYPNDRIEDINPADAKKTVIDKLNELNPDVVLSGAFAFTSGAAAIDWAKANNKAVVIFDDSKRSDVQRNFVVNLVKKAIYKYVDAIFCPSEDWLDTFTSWGFKKESVFYGVDVVDNDFWSQKSNYTSDLPQQYFLSVGRQIERKNFHTVINSFSHFLHNNPDSLYELLVVGDGSEKEQLRSLVMPENKDKIHFLPFQNQQQLRELYQRAMFFIMPSIQEQWGLVVNEAMASGCPIVISRQCGCAKTLVQDNVNGFYFDTNNAEELSRIFEKIEEMSADEIREMSDASKNIIRDWGLERFTIGAIDAINYSITHKRRPMYCLGKFLLKIWKGRYNLS